MEMPAAPTEPEPSLPPAAPTLPDPRERALDGYAIHQKRLMYEAFAREHPELSGALADPLKMDAVGLWWVEKGYAAAFTFAAKKLRDTGEDRLPELGDLEIDSEDEDREALKIAEGRFGRHFE